MYSLYYIGLDLHKKSISFCIKAMDGRLIGQGKIVADRQSLGEWIQGHPGPWIGAMEATIFTSSHSVRSPPMTISAFYPKNQPTFSTLHPRPTHP